MSDCVINLSAFFHVTSHADFMLLVVIMATLGWEIMVHSRL